MNELDLLKDLKILRRHVDRLIKKYSQLVTITSVTTDKSDNMAGFDEFAQLLLDKWNKGLGTQKRMTDRFRSSLKGRLKSFKAEEIQKAIENRIHFLNTCGNKWYETRQGYPHKINIYLVLRNDDDLDKWLNVPSKEIESEEVKITSFKKKGNKNILE